MKDFKVEAGLKKKDGMKRREKEGGIKRMSRSLISSSTKTKSEIVLKVEN